MKDFLTYASPESAGIASGDIVKFLDDLEVFGAYVHSFAVVKGHKIIAEGYRPPFHRDELHRMYSISKTYAAMAVGVLIGDGEIALDDKFIKWFPEYAHCDDPNLTETTIEDLLKMNAPFAAVPTYCARVPGNLEKHWLETFFVIPTTHPSGTVWNYDTSATYVLGVITERIVKKPFMEFLYERVLSKIDCSKEAHCMKTPDGYSWNGSACMCTTLDLAKFARFIMDEGCVDGEQLIPRDFMQKAVSRLTDNNENGFCNPENGHGYGYQIWRTLDNSFSLIGMGNQLAMCMPDKDLVFVCTADHQGDPAMRPILYTTVWQDIKQKCGAPLPEDPAAWAALKERCANMPYPVVAGEKDSAWDIWNKKMVLTENKMEISEITFKKKDDGTAVMCYVNPQGYKEIPFGFGEPVISTFPQDGYGGTTAGVPSDRRFRCITSGAWTTPDTLRIKCDVIDIYFGSVNMVFVFKGNQAGIHFHRNAQWLLDEYQGFATGTFVE